MKANEIIRALECMPGDAEVYFEQWIQLTPGERTLSVKQVDVVNCVTNANSNGVFSEIIFMCESDMVEMDDDCTEIDIIEAYRQEDTR